MKYLIDTNVISEIRKGPRCDPHVTAWYQTVEPETLYVSVLVLGEIRKGIERAKPKNLEYANRLGEWLGRLPSVFSERVMPIDAAIADEWGRMSAGRTLAVIDGLLAATAKVHGMTLVTRNTSDVMNLGIDVLNPFDRAI
ncbi:MAG: type II toxin-antitoxin system VapC family toxin [Rhodospirillaceae bacterium]|nr:type II toxin-antitoxin system VapC family toxin [Rhodospirillaceae bacterium]